MYSFIIKYKRWKSFLERISVLLVIALLLTPAAKSGHSNLNLIAQDTGQNALKRKPLIVFLVTRDSNNYEAHRTIPVFAAMLTKKHGYETVVLTGKGDHGAYRFPDFEIVPKADVIVVFSRRVALPQTQMNTLKAALQNGKPVIGIRTANHAFSVSGEIEEGYEDWPGFVTDILGCQNRGYGPESPGTHISTVSAQKNHIILKGVTPGAWHSKGNLYHVKPLLDERANILLTGKVNDTTEPVAWTRMAGKSKVFYTSLGFPDDFKTSQFKLLLVNAIRWALEKN